MNLGFKSWAIDCINCGFVYKNRVINSCVSSNQHRFKREGKKITIGEKQV